MNAGDAAALAVAKYQGELLNRIGALNISHLEAALENDEVKCEELMKEKRETCFLAPLEGIRIGNEAAKSNGIEIDGEEHGVMPETGCGERRLYSRMSRAYYCYFGL